MRATQKIATVLLLGASFGSSAFGAVTLQSIASVNGLPTAVATPPKTVTQVTANGTATGTGANAAGSPISATVVNIAKFDASTGILMSGWVNVDNVATQVRASVKATPVGSAGGRTATANSTNWTGSVSGTGFTAITNAATSASRTCGTGAGQTACSSVFSAASGTASTLSGLAAIADASLSAYVYTGAPMESTTISLNRTADGGTSVTAGSRANNASSSSDYTFAGGTYSIVYDYLNFSAPSFDPNSQMLANVLDFGRIAKNSGPIALTFAITNIGDIHSAGSSLTSITRDDATTPFTTDAATFTNLLGGATSTTFTVWFNPVVNGMWTDTFHFNLADYAPGGIGGRNSVLDLVVTGATVPEPATWATLILGFALVGASARRRRGKVVAA